MGRPSIPIETQLERYRKLVAEEERRIEELTRKAFSKLRHVSSHPNEVIGKKYDSKYDKASLDYLKQRYYRLKRVTASDVKQATYDYRFEDWLFVLKTFFEHYQISGKPEVLEFLTNAKRLTKRERIYFMEQGFDGDLTAIYQDLGEDLRNNVTTTLDQLNYLITLPKEEM